MNKIIFLDRDGVLNIEKEHYISSVDDFEINPLIIPFLKKAIEKNFKLVVITNQGGIAKGLYTHETLHQIHHKMQSEFSVHGIRFDDIFYCPHHDDFGKCLCRKPASLMIERAIHRYHADKALCFMIGDRPRDIIAAEQAGIRGFLVEPNSSLDFLMEELK
ncbi:MAG: HAD family hydrolase [Bacteroidia bacterium]|nr:HAD family hydrolase [Bacteroidia bacterium]MCO5253211.1 HAD family hydrolase [Bacteroidota bacterium]MCZ2128822.1 HAD family hydrolase [Bacteroidia bacterium]